VNATLGKRSEAERRNRRVPPCRRAGATAWHESPTPARNSRFLALALSIGETLFCGG
jgi:hypothetical protein